MDIVVILQEKGRQDRSDYSQIHEGDIHIEIRGRGELMAEIEFVDANQIFLAFLDEITGFTASNTTISNRNKGRAEKRQEQMMATVLKHGITDEKIQALLPGGVPTEILVDNRSLFDTTSYSMSKPLKKLKTLVRFINMIKEAVKNGELKQTLVASKDQPADMLTKAHSSPTQQWRHIETLQGTHAVITEIRERVNKMKAQRAKQGRLVQLTQSSEEEEMNVVTAATAITSSSEADTPEERAEKELQRETDENTARAAQESEEMRQFRFDIKDRVERTYCHEEQRKRIGGGARREQETGKKQNKDEEGDDERGEHNKRTRTKDREEDGDGYSYDDGHKSRGAKHRQRQDLRRRRNIP